MSIIDGKVLATKSDCYKTAQKMTPKGIVVHSTGANNPNLKRYVQPDDGNLGVNPNKNDFNRSGVDVCPHGWIGKDKNNKVKFYQTLPFNYCCWGVGSGSKGSYNYNPAYIQFEMCEDGLTDKSYCTAVYNKAVEVCIYLCKTYNISVNNIVSHHEAGQKGYGSSHVDPDNWWGKHGYTMDKFRAAVKAGLNNKTTTTTESTKPITNISSNESSSVYKVQVGAFKNESNAKNQLSKLKAKKIDGIVVKSGQYYKVQAGAFNSKSNADNLLKKIKSAGFDATIVTGAVSSSSKISKPTIKVGSTVTIKKGAKTYDGQSLASFVYNRKYKVSELSGTRAVITYNGDVVAAMKISDLSLT